MFKGKYLESGIIIVTIGILIFVVFYKANIYFNNNYAQMEEIFGCENMVRKNLVISLLVLIFLGLNIMISSAQPFEQWNITFGGIGSDTINSFCKPQMEVIFLQVVHLHMGMVLLLPG